MNLSERDAHAVMLCVIIFLLGLVCISVGAAKAQDQQHDHALMGDVGKFYGTWYRPKGNFSGIGHRTQSCCNRSDCFSVGETRMIGGRYEVRPELPDGTLGNWFKVDPSIIESNQSDPRESPDGRSHVCIIGGIVACFTEGGGI